MSHRRMLFILLVLGLAGQAMAQVNFRQPQPGDVYKEFVRTISIGGDDWRVTDPNVNLSWYPQAAAFLPNPSLDISVDDLSGATRAEAVITLWGGHVGTTGKKLSFNGNAWITIPELTGINGIPGGTSGECYISQVNVVVDVPLAHLVVGTNTFRGTNEGQSCYSFQWGQHGWYGLILRVYYGGGKNPPGGSITSPASGAVIGDTPTIQVSTTGSVSQVDILGYFDGYDTDGDGIFLEYHGDYHRGLWDDMVLRNHVGTAFGSSPSIVWDNSWVPDQNGIKLIARIKGANGVWFVTNEVTGINLARATSSVRMYKPAALDERAWARGDLPPVECYLTIPAEHNVGTAVQAAYHVRTWNGLDNVREPGEKHYRRVNDSYDWSDWSAAEFGENHYYDYDVVGVNVGTLRSGSNVIGFFSETVSHHGIEILWPGPAITVRWGTPLPVKVVSFTWQRAAVSGLRLEWKTISEINNFGFEVQRATGAPTNFVTLPGSFQPGAPTSTTERSYAYTDPQPVQGVAYYRLRQMDLDGTVTHSEPLRVDLTTGVAEESVPDTYQLFQNHPNPFNPVTTIEFALPKEEDVLLTVYSPLGQLVSTLVSEKRGAGRYSVRVDGSGWSSGVYLYRLQAGPFVETRKLVLTR